MPYADSSCCWSSCVVVSGLTQGLSLTSLMAALFSLMVLSASAVYRKDEELTLHQILLSRHVNFEANLTSSRTSTTTAIFQHPLLPSVTPLPPAIVDTGNGRSAVAADLSHILYSKHPQLSQTAVADKPMTSFLGFSVYHKIRRRNALLENTTTAGQFPVEVTEPPRDTVTADVNSSFVKPDDDSSATTYDDSISGGNRTVSGRRKADSLSRRWFPVSNAAQQGGEGASFGVVRSGWSQPRSKDQPTFSARLVYGAVALVLASLLTPVVFVLIGLARNRIKKYVEYRKRFDKSGEYERVGSVSSVVDSCSVSGSQFQLDIGLDDPLAVEDVTII